MVNADTNVKPVQDYTSVSGDRLLGVRVRYDRDYSMYERFVYLGHEIVHRVAISIFSKPVFGWGQDLLMPGALEGKY